MLEPCRQNPYEISGVIAPHYRPPALAVGISAPIAATRKKEVCVGGNRARDTIRYEVSHHILGEIEYRRGYISVDLHIKIPFAIRMHIFCKSVVLPHCPVKQRTCFCVRTDHGPDMEDAPHNAFINIMRVSGREASTLGDCRVAGILRGVMPAKVLTRRKSTAVAKMFVLLDS